MRSSNLVISFFRELSVGVRKQKNSGEWTAEGERELFLFIVAFDASFALQKEDMIVSANLFGWQLSDFYSSQNE